VTPSLRIRAVCSDEVAVQAAAAATLLVRL
jgi:hypothetical protein